jgi:hypothetical protein
VVACGVLQAKELRDALEERREGLEKAFDPLRDYIEKEKKLFCERNAGAIEKLIQRRVEEGVKRRLPKIVRAFSVQSIF